ncbi:hypothetical protein [Halorubrum sp. CSM-61]|uniref:hypothetical protein n=1 Tax=Halorubrum sp. CSM-61 TaxID=2485838 RepID=UPI000F4C24A5|nr:hypothetical protein [Halorubrum sp. CSM-61]
MSERDTLPRGEQPPDDTGHRASGETDELEAGDTHVGRGVGSNTRVECPEHDTVYGPHPGARSTFNYCPYCGDDTSDADHDTKKVDGEVFCPDTGMSTYRFCPGCGAQVDE